jgi:hypothetical protein
VTPERWRQIEELFHAAAGRGAHHRDAFLIKACCADVALRREVELLFAQAQSHGGAVLHSVSPETSDDSSNVTRAAHKRTDLIGVAGCVSHHRAS